MNRYLVRRNPNATVSDVFIWTEHLAKRKDLEEVFADSPADAIQSDAMPDANNVTLGQLDGMSKEKLIIFGTKRLGLKLSGERQKQDLLHEVKVALFMRPSMQEPDSVEARAEAAKREPVVVGAAAHQTRPLGPGEAATKPGM